MVFVRLTLKTPSGSGSGYPTYHTYIRPEMIASIHEEPANGGLTIISMVNGHTYKVEGTAEEIINEISSLAPCEIDNEP